jgi:hypothetical protein
LCQERNRRVERINAIAYHSGALQDKIHSFKYEGKTGWSLIFGRLLVGWLEAHAGDDPPDLIVANPTYLDPGQSGTGHIETIIRSAATADYEGRWIFDTSAPAAIIKHRQRTSQPEGALPRSERPQQPSAEPCTSPNLPEHKGATSSYSTTCAPPATSSTQPPAACSTKATRPASVPWSWHEHRGGEHSVDTHAPTKKCHGTETGRG